MENVIVAAGTEAFGVDLHVPFASLAGCEFWFPIYFFVASVAEAFSVMFFFFRAIATLFYHHAK